MASSKDEFPCVVHGVVILPAAAGRPGPVRVCPVSGRGGEALHDGAFVAPDGRFDIEFPADPRPRWEKSGIDEISFLVHIDGARVTAVGADGMKVWNVRQLPLEGLVLRVPEAEGHVRDPHAVEGDIVLENGLPAANVPVRLYLRGFGGAARLAQQGQTDAGGHYKLTYDAGGRAQNLEIRALDHAGREVALSTTKLNAAKNEVLDLVAPEAVRPPAAELTRLTADLAPYVGERANLTRARETDGQGDLSLLHEATGWDARLLAMAATAERIGAETGVPSEALYALFRVGVPADAQSVAALPAGAARESLVSAQKAGVVEMDERALAKAHEQLVAFQRKARLEFRAPGGLSTVGDFLAHAGLSQAQRDALLELSFERDTTSGEFWEKAAAAGLPAEKLPALKLQGKLALLTRDNAALSASLGSEIGSPEALSKLVDADLFEPDAWVKRVERLAGGDPKALDALVPPDYQGASARERLSAYSEDLARKVRVAFPTEVIVRRVSRGEISLGPRHESLKGPVKSFLETARGLGYQLGAAPVGAFVRENAQKLKPQGVSDALFAETVEAIRTLHRLYQITPTDASMAALSRLGFTSARAVADYPHDLFVARFGEHFPSSDEAKLVHRKAQQVSAVAYGFFSGARQLDSSPPMFATSPSQEGGLSREEAKAELLKQYPTMEALFGSMDFCECEHCRSVLSPAAYLVDLLQFINPSDEDWKRFLDDWKAKHGGQDYEATYQKPFAVLDGRRPDLQHLPLTCENTNTAVPYIDLVNEILEFQVAHGALSKDAVRDTGSATSEELLAEPQYILPAAYDALAKARYPLTLPFDLWTETVRRFLAQGGVSLAEVLEAFRTGSELSATGGAAYGRAAVFIESLGLSAAEHRLLTDSAPLGRWHELYGYASEATALAELRSAKTLARRLGLRYTELVGLLKTWFVNPKLDALVLLRKLGLEVGDVLRYKGVAGLSPLSQDERSSFEAALDEASKRYASSGFDARAWLDGAYAAGDFGAVFVLADESAGCDFDATRLQDARGDAPGPLVLLAMNLFVRLSRRLGWGVEDLDRALRAFIPSGSLPLSGSTIGPALDTALLYLAHLEALASRLGLGREGRSRLVSLWSDITTPRARSLYAELFLTPSVLASDPIFDHPLGRYLEYYDTSAGAQRPFRWDPSQAESAATGNVSLAAHLPAVQAALGLAAAEIEAILVSLGRSTSGAALSVEVLSTLYRRGLLARALGLSVGELLTVIELSGLDPFEPLAPGPLATVDKDHPLVGTLQLLDVVDAIRASGLSVDDVSYLVRHRFDSLGPNRLDAAALTSLRRAIAAGLGGLSAENPSATPEALRRRTLADALVGALSPSAALAEAVRSNAHLLGPLLDPLAAAASAGVTAAYYPSADGSGQPSLTADVARASTTGAPVGTSSAVLSGVIEVATAGVYRLFVRLDKKDAEARVRFEHLPTALIDARAGADGAELEGQVELKAGVPYAFSFTFRHLGGGEASVWAESEGLEKGPLERLPLTPSGAVDQVSDAFVRARKCLKLADGLGLDEADLRHLAAYAADFDLPSLSLLPSRFDASQAGLQAAQKAFGGLLRLFAVAKLKAELSPGSADLAALFEASRAGGATLEGLCGRLAQLTRRADSTVLAAANAHGLTVASFRTERALVRLWGALQIVEKLGVSVETITRCTRIVQPSLGADERLAIGRDLRDAIKARRSPQSYRLIARPIFDALRARQRDALVAYLLHALGLESVEALYEHFLIDPGNEPVVKTSRIRLATASVQLFIRRCLLNLEKKVSPAAIRAEEWSWMQRYRVWEANRKIFLFPENWLEPELRDDRTHLFEELEGALLKGDVSEDLVNDAFARYLSGLEDIARLEIVSTHLEPDPHDASGGVLHVIGRTYNQKKYFYRTCAHRMWTPWEPLDAEIEADQVAVVKWRERVFVFWVTFLQKGKQDTNAETKVRDVADQTVSTGLVHEVALQLHWTERFQGEWKARRSSGFSAPIALAHELDPGRVFVHVSKEYEDGDEGAVRVHLRIQDALIGTPVHIAGRGTFTAWEVGTADVAFRLPGKNSEPEVVAGEAPPEVPYTTSGMTATRRTHRGALDVTFVERSVSTLNMPAKKTEAHRTILGAGASFSLLPLDAPVSTPTLGGDIGALSAPFFYQDSKNTFFVRPTVTELVFSSYGGWVVGRKPGAGLAVPEKPAPRPVKPFIPGRPKIGPKGPDDPWGPYARFALDKRSDWVIDPATHVAFDGRLIGSRGPVDGQAVKTLKTL